MAGDSECLSDCPSESDEKAIKMKCCVTKDVSVLVCIRCYAVFHKSCAKRIQNVRIFSDHRVVCSDCEAKNGGSQSQVNENINKGNSSVDTVLLENSYLKQILKEVQEKNDVLQLNNKLLLDRIRFEESIKKSTRIQNQNIHKNPDKGGFMVPEPPNPRMSLQGDRGRLTEINARTRPEIENTKTTEQFQRNNEKSELVNQLSLAVDRRQIVAERATLREGDRNVSGNNNNSQQNLNENTESKSEHENEGVFTEVTYRKRNRSSNKMGTTRGYREKSKHKKIGKAEVSEEEKRGGFSGRERRLWLYINRVNNHVKPSDILEYIKKKPGFESADIGVKELQNKAAEKVQSPLKSFVVAAPITKKDEMYDEDFWPVGVGIGRFSFRAYRSTHKEDFLEL